MEGLDGNFRIPTCATWSHIGATETPQVTHRSIRTAIEAFNNWQDENVIYEPYLSGSYGNSTNIHGNSDVDLVVEVTSISYSNLTHEEVNKLGLESTNYSWTKFRQDVVQALRNYYGSSFVDTSGKKAVKVLPNSNRQKADVVISATYNYYEDLKLRDSGIVFWTQPGGQLITNYPKTHLRNGERKNSDNQTRGWYKKTIRAYKNARDKIYSNKPELQDSFPSYFIECLLYNVPNDRFGGTYKDNFLDTLNWLNDELYSERVSKMECQNGMYYLFGNTSVTWNVLDAKRFIGELINLWNNW